MTDSPTKTPWHLWLVGVIAVLFNSIGAYDHVMYMTRGAAYLASVGMSPAQIAHYQNMPAVMLLVWAIGVWGAMLGSVLLLLRNRRALPVFVVSLVAFLLNMLYTWVLSDGGRIIGRQMAPVSVVITVMLIGFIWYSRVMTRRSVLR